MHLRAYGRIKLSIKSEEKERERARLPSPGQLSPNKLLMIPGFEPIEMVDSDHPSEDCFINEVLHFEECCRTGAEPISSGRDNIETVKVILGILESARTGRGVDLDGL